jgi:hypothetical protein
VQPQHRVEQQHRVEPGRTAEPRRGGRPPLFQTLFAVQDNAVPELRLAGLPTRFVRQPYLELPLELHAELWPATGGGLLLTVYSRPDAVSDATVAELAKRFTDRLHTSAPKASR